MEYSALSGAKQKARRANGALGVSIAALLVALGALGVGIASLVDVNNLKDTATVIDGAKAGEAVRGKAALYDSRGRLSANSFAVGKDVLANIKDINYAADYFSQGISTRMGFLQSMVPVDVPDGGSITHTNRRYKMETGVSGNDGYTITLPSCGTATDNHDIILTVTNHDGSSDYMIYTANNEYVFGKWYNVNDLGQVEEDGRNAAQGQDVLQLGGSKDVTGASVLFTCNGNGKWEYYAWSPKYQAAESGDLNPAGFGST